MLEELLTDEAYGQELVLLNLLCEHLITVRARAPTHPPRREPRCTRVRAGPCELGTR